MVSSQRNFFFYVVIHNLDFKKKRVQNALLIYIYIRALLFLNDPWTPCIEKYKQDLFFPNFTKLNCDVDGNKCEYTQDAVL